MDGHGGWLSTAVDLVVWSHSRHDANVPLPAAKRVVDRLRSVDLRLWQGGHLESFHREEELMRDLLARAEVG